MGEARIPEGVYYNDETANFYNNLGDGMGMAFWQKWRHASKLFPQDEEHLEGKPDVRNTLEEQSE